MRARAPYGTVWAALRNTGRGESVELAKQVLAKRFVEEREAVNSGHHLLHLGSQRQRVSACHCSRDVGVQRIGAEAVDATPTTTKFTPRGLEDCFVTSPPGGILQVSIAPGERGGSTKHASTR